MTSALLIIHIIIAIGMVGIILIQKNEGGGLGSGSGNMGGLMTTRGSANLLTHITAVFAILFFLSTLSLAIVFKGDKKSSSILDLPETQIKKTDSVSPIPLKSETKSVDNEIKTSVKTSQNSHK